MKMEFGPPYWYNAKSSFNYYIWYSLRDAAADIEKLYMEKSPYLPNSNLQII